MFLISSVTSSIALAFLLVHPDYQLARPNDTTINIASGGCQANGISNSELRGAIDTSINQYWNTIAESRLKLKVGDEVPRPLSGLAEPGEILVGCQALGTNGASGVTSPSIANGSATIVLNGTTLVPGGYLPAGLIGVLAHEIGHAIGLDHSADPASVMTYEDHDWYAQPTYLSQDDKDGVAYLYPRAPQLGGLLGGCSAIAAQGSATKTLSLENLLLELLFFAGTLILIRNLRFYMS